MIDKAAPSLMRIYTAHDSVVYVDETTKELRHGPPEICPANAFFKLEDSSGEIVFLFGDHELPVDDRGDDGLAARVDRPPAFKPTKFEIIEVEYGLAGLRAGSHFLAAEPNGRIVTNRGHCLAWERFRLHAHQTLDSERSEEAIAHFNPAIPLGRGTTFNKQETYVGLPLVSFVVACYNQSKYINDLIDSILGQTVKDIELILVDDGSTDDTGELVRKYNDRRLIYIRQPNAGPSAAINRGLDFARADYIAFSGGDDVSCPERVETQIAQIRESDGDLIFGLPSIIGEESEPLPDEAMGIFFSRSFESSVDLYRSLFLHGNFLCAPSVLARKSFFETYGRFKLGLIQLQDFEMWIRACRLGANLAMYPTRTLRYRVRSQSENLSAQHFGRIAFEQTHVYRSFFDDAPLGFLKKAFPGSVLDNDKHRGPETECEILFLYLNHSWSTLRAIGADRITAIVDDPRMRQLLEERRFSLKDLFALTDKIR